MTWPRAGLSFLLFLELRHHSSEGFTSTPLRTLFSSLSKPPLISYINQRLRTLVTNLVPSYRPFPHSNKQWHRVEVGVDKNTANVWKCPPEPRSGFIVRTYWSGMRERSIKSLQHCMPANIELNATYFHCLTEWWRVIETSFEIIIADFYSQLFVESLRYYSSIASLSKVDLYMFNFRCSIEWCRELPCVLKILGKVDTEFF